MKVKTQILLGYIVFYVVVFYGLVDLTINEIRPRYLETVEESLNDTANILALQLESNLVKGKLNFKSLESVFPKIIDKKISAQIYGLKKTNVSINVYVTDNSGIVVYDSVDKKNVGKDYSQWNDVYLTLKGKYGVRSSRSIMDDPSTSSFFVGAPIKYNEKIIGVVSVVKPKDSISPFVEMAKNKIIAGGILTGFGFLAVSFLISFLITSPILKLTVYVKSLKQNKRLKFPKLGNGEIGDLGVAFEEMRVDIEGKKYIEQYIQAFTHELKSPLSSIQGAAELLQEDMSTNEKDKFHKNILTESKRIGNIIERLLQLSSIENRKEIKDSEIIDVADLVSEIIESLQPQLNKKNISIQSAIGKDIFITGERFLIRHALTNLIQNSIQFSEDSGEIKISSSTENLLTKLVVIDSGSGIPNYAEDKIFDKFYSLSSNKGVKNGTGLGLPFVREVALLHGGSASVINREKQGVVAEISFLNQ